MNQHFLSHSHAPSFEDLLSRLAAEHQRSVEELQAEVAQLNMRLSNVQNGHGGGASCDFLVLPAPEEGRIRSPREHGGRGLATIRSEYSSHRQTQGSDVQRLAQRSSAKTMLEWTPAGVEHQSADRTPSSLSSDTLPVTGSRWRNRAPAVDKLKPFDWPTMLPVSAALQSKAQNSGALQPCSTIQAASVDALWDEEELENARSSRETDIWSARSPPEADIWNERGQTPRNQANDALQGASTFPASFSPIRLSNGTSLSRKTSGVAEVQPPVTVNHSNSMDIAAASSMRSLGGTGRKTAHRIDNLSITLHETWRNSLEGAAYLEDEDDKKDEASCSIDMPISKTPLKRQMKKGRSIHFLEARHSWSLDRLVLHPNNIWRVTWDLLGFLLLLWDLTSIPMQVFNLGTAGFSGTYKSILHVNAMVSTIFWTVDMLVNFFTGFYSCQGYLRMEFRIVFRRYLKTWFVVDLILVVTDWVTLSLGILAGSNIMRIGKTVARFLRIFRLLRFVKLSSALQEMLDRINSEYIVTLVGVAKILLGIIIMNHYIACGWYGLSQWDLATGTWLTKVLNDQPGESWRISYLYLTSLHWSLTQFTPASMEVVPQNAYERGYNVVIIVIGVVAFSSFVSSITGAMTYIRIMNSRKTEQNACLRRFFTERSISQDMASRVWHWSQNTRSARTFKESDVQVLTLLPDRTRRDLRYELHAPILQAHPLFYHYHYLDLLTFRQICDTATVEVSLKPGQNVFGESLTVDKMFFVLHGCVDYHHTKAQILDKRRMSTRSSQAASKIHAGGWACEVALWATHARMSGEFVGGLSGLYGAELMTMKSNEFVEAIQANPKSMIYLAQYAALFVGECCNDRYGMSAPYLFFNDLDALQEIAQRALDNLTANQKSAMSSDHDRQVHIQEFDAHKAKRSKMSRVSGWMATLRLPSDEDVGDDDY